MSISRRPLTIEIEVKGLLKTVVKQGWFYELLRGY